MQQPCSPCNARCCRYFCFPIDEPRSYEEFDQVRWYLVHKGVRVHIDPDGVWYIRIDNLCKNLRRAGRGWRCADYANRPLICRRFSPSACDFTRGPHPCREMFRSGKELETYARRVLGKRAFERARERSRSKSSGRRRGGK